MKHKICICLFILLGMQAYAQNTTAKVTDSQSGEGLPYANIDINGDNSITNAEGNFSVSQNNNSDDLILTVTYLGYNSARITLAQLKANQYIVKLSPGVFELETLHISNTAPNADSIMAAVKKNLVRNYKRPDHAVKNTLFYRESQTFKPIKLNVAITKSTGFTKDGLKDTNRQLQALTSNLVAHPPQEFTEMLCNYYTKTLTLNGKTGLHPKFNVVKAIKLKDPNRAVSLSELQTMASGILFQHLDTTKYYRIKSGLFGSRDTIPLVKAPKKSNEKPKSELSAAKFNVTNFIYKYSFNNNNKLDFITSPQLYEYNYQGAVALGSQYVYVLKFRPKKSGSKYSGTLYISDTDYAVVKAEYVLAEGKTLGGVNLKFFLGVKQSENISRGTIIYKKRETGNDYYLQYAVEETGQYIYFNRPLKFIEITKTERDVAAFDLKVETNILEKTEYFSMSQSDVSEDDFKSAQE